MRVLLDANIFISYLLSPASDTPPMIVVEAAFTGAYTLLPATLIAYPKVCVARLLVHSQALVVS